MEITANDLQRFTFGVEIETIGQPRERVANAIAQAVHGYTYGTTVVDPEGRHWEVKRDGSLFNGGAEVVTPILRYSDMDTLQDVIRAIRTKAKAKVNDTCGIHIHIGASEFTGKQLVNLVNLVYSNESLIYKALGVCDNRKRRYTKPVEQSFVDTLKRVKPTEKTALQHAWYENNTFGYSRRNPVHFTNAHYEASRYHGLNLHAVFNKGTVEFRYFEATLHAGKVRAYITFVLALAAYATAKSRIVAKQKPLIESCERFDFRCLLIHLGLNGKTHKNVREHLLALLQGSNSRAIGRTC